MIIDRPAASLRPVYAVTTGTSYEGDESLIRRIINSFMHSMAANRDLGDSEWKTIINMNAEVLRAFAENDFVAAAAFLRDPVNTKLLYGFEPAFAIGAPESLAYFAPSALDALCRLAEATGSIRADNPESYGARDPIIYEAEEILAAVDKTLGWQFTVPNPFPAENGTLTSRGVISQRMPHALYQAWRIKQLTGHVARPRVLEIGGGLGRTAYYAREFGIADYTIVDLPMSGIAQAYFLGRTLGGDALSLAGEERRASDAAAVKLRPPEWFLNTDESFDLVIAVDCLTEMDRAVADAYWSKIKLSSGRFWSLNHEVNKFRVADVLADRPPLISVERNCCWLRRGYVEETVILRR